MTETEQRIAIPTAENLRKMVDDKDNERREEIKETVSFILDSIGEFIRYNMDEIVKSEKGAKYTLSEKSIRRMCEVKSKPLFTPSTSKELNVLVDIIINMFSDNGYRVSIAERSPLGNSLVILISANPKLLD